MSDDDWNEAGKKLIQLSDGRIEDIVNESAIQAQNKDYIIKTLKARRDNALTWWIENTKTGYNSIEDIRNNTPILRMDLFKAVDEELEKEKNAPVYFDFMDKKMDRGEATDEDIEQHEKNRKEFSETFYNEMKGLIK